MRTLLFLIAAATLNLQSFAGEGVKVDTKTSKLGWLAKKVTGQHNGEVIIKSGSLEIDNNTLTGGEFVINMTSINVLDITNEEYNTKLVNHLNSPDFFNTAEFPEAKFKITSAKKSKSDQGNYEITGDLTIKGITKPVTFPAQVDVKDGNILASATIIFDRAQYDVKYGSGSFFDNLGDKTIYDEVEMKVNLVARK